jgi:S1/P1 Nuclease
MRLLLALLLLALPAPALAWWEYGHEMSARIAEAYLTPKARNELRRLMAKQAQLDTPECPVRNLQEASLWADCIKQYRDRFSYQNSWHYQNVSVCRPFEPRANCPDGNCVSAQIPRNARLLADRKLPDRERLQALAYLVHFVGDIHQPMHAGDNADRGGNDVAANYGAIQTPRLNLHAIWDGYLAERSFTEPPGELQGLLASVTPEQFEAWSQGTVVDWHREAWQHSRDLAYGKLPVGDVCQQKPAERVTIDEAYVQATRDEVRRQMQKAGIRLARMLNEAIG